MTVATVAVSANPLREPSFRSSARPVGPVAFHRKLPGYCPSPMFDVAELASALGVGRLLVKDESDRFGLPAFKMLGASWATYRRLVERLGAEPGPWATLDDLAGFLTPLRPLDLATATDGNHGRAVAHLARLLGLGARIFVPAGTAAARIDAIVGEGATCTVVDGTYDDAVARAAEEEAPDCLVVSDTSWPGYDVVPRWVIDGYATIFAELDEQLRSASLPDPDVVLVPSGVGALAAAAADWFRRPALGQPPRLIGIEPATAECMGASARAGRLVEVPGPHRSVMAGLNCGEVSPVAWPIVAPAFDAFAAVDDAVAVAGMQALAAHGIVSGESGACTVGLLVTAGARELGIGPDDVVLALSTEGATDPDFYRAAVGADPAAVAGGAPLCASDFGAGAGVAGRRCTVPDCCQPCRAAVP
jgi:diaminopropionate ammonia-lyase